MLSHKLSQLIFFWFNIASPDQFMISVSLRGTSYFIDEIIYIEKLQIACG